MKTGDLLIIGHGRTPHLVCSVCDLEDDTIRAEVINGLWILIWFRGYMWTEKYGNAVKGKILYHGPMIPHSGYNDLMHKSEAFLKWGMFKFIYRWLGRVVVFKRRVVKTAQAGSKAVRREWTGKGGWSIDIDDDFPF